jgi:hypothetical protein
MSVRRIAVAVGLALALAAPLPSAGWPGFADRSVAGYSVVA